MPESYLNYRGLKPGQHSWYWNRRRESVPVYPGDWVHLDLSTHPEVQPAIQAGMVILEELAPPDAEVLDEATIANRQCNEYGKVFPLRPPRRPRGRGRPEIFALTGEQLRMTARCFLPWPGWQADLERLCAFSEARPHRRGARSRIVLPMPFDVNFPVLHRIAELITRQLLEDFKKNRESQIESSWIPGEYDSKKLLRKIYKRRMPLPSRRKTVGEILQSWHAWEGPGAPSSRTLRRYRAALVADSSVRACVDEQILDVLKNPGQRIVLGNVILGVGNYVPHRAASPALTQIRTVGCTVLIIRPSYEATASSTT